MGKAINYIITILLTIITGLGTFTLTTLNRVALKQSAALVIVSRLDANNEVNENNIAINSMNIAVLREQIRTLKNQTND